MGKLEKDTVSRKIFVVINAVLLALVAILSLYPIIYCFLISISESDKVMGNVGFVWKPLGFSLAAYKTVLTNPNIGTGYLNTIFIVVVGTAVNMLLTSMAAYFLTRKMVLNKILMPMIVFTMYFNGGLVPSFLLVNNLGLYDKIFAVIIPTAISAYNLIVLKAGFATIPESLIESAELDGAGPWRTLFQIVIPLAKASLAVITLYYAVAHWNDWFNAQIYLQTPKKFPLQLVLRQILLENSGNEVADDLNSTRGERIAETVQYAIIMVATIPILCVYPFIQKYFEKGIMLGAVKG
nr:carbohydrate ABC transporter permease [Qingrenia yutianensis]